MNYATGISAACVTVVCWTVGTFAFTKASRQVDPIPLNRVRLLYAVILLGVCSVLFFGVSLHDLLFFPKAEEWFWLGLSGIVGLTISDYFSFNAYRILGSSKTSLFNTFSPFAALLLGMILLDETIGLKGITGMCISVGGMVWFVRISTRKQQTQQDHNTKDTVKGIIYAILGAIGQGLGIVLTKKGLLVLHGSGDLSPVHAAWIRMVCAAGITYFIGIFRTNLVSEFRMITFNAANFKPVITGTLFGPVLGVSFSLLAASLVEASVAQTILSLLPISVMVAASVTGKEKVEPTAFIAALVSIAGVFILVWK